MKMVKVERRGATAEGMIDGDSVRVFGGWRDGPAEEAPFTLSKRSAVEVAALTVTETVPLSSVTLAVPIDPLAKSYASA